MKKNEKKKEADYYRMNIKCNNCFCIFPDIQILFGTTEHSYKCNNDCPTCGCNLYGIDKEV